MNTQINTDHWSSLSTSVGRTAEAAHSASHTFASDAWSATKFLLFTLAHLLLVGVGVVIGYFVWGRKK